MTPKDAQDRLKILRFWDKHGLAATVDAFGVSRRTLWRLRAAACSRRHPGLLTARSCRPKRVRKPRHDAPMVAEIRRLRTLSPNLGKDKLACLPKPWCQTRGIACPSASTIGRITYAPPTRCATPSGR